jgi:hypothetical protein
VQLHREIGLNPSKESGLSCLGIKVRKVEFRLLGILPCTLTFPPSKEINPQHIIKIDEEFDKPSIWPRAPLLLERRHNHYKFLRCDLLEEVGIIFLFHHSREKINHFQNIPHVRMIWFLEEVREIINSKGSQILKTNNLIVGCVLQVPIVFVFFL